MRPQALALAIAICAAAALLAAVPTAAKDDVKAILTTPIPLDAAAGTKLRVSWRLIHVPEDGRQRRFGASGVFVRLRSAYGAASQQAMAPDLIDAPGEFTTTVVVPEGGIGDIEIGLIGWRSDASGTHRSDLLFPIVNDPLPGESPDFAPPLGEQAGSGALSWPVIAASGLALAALCLLALVRLRRGRMRRRT